MSVGPEIPLKPAEEARSALARLRVQLAPLLGDAPAKRLKAHADGSLYVEATVSAAVLAWLIDTVLVDGAAIGLGVLTAARSSDPYAPAGGAVVALLLLVILPLLYGWCYRDGRALGALLAGTRLVRMSDGGRIGLPKAGWAMLIRTLFLPFIFWAALEGTGDVGQVRTSIDENATIRLRNAGHARIGPADGVRTE
ncbi:hypothetical protein [Microbacterium sp. 22242]|uniref:hypothetical protein n=1 Tax=Microbacterium sp. 22242 TaxID=3453896 RepID=UPI003F856A6F